MIICHTSKKSLIAKQKTNISRLTRLYLKTYQRPVDRTLMTAVSRSTEWVFVVYRLLAWCELIWEYEERWGNETDTQDSVKKRDTEKTIFKWMLFSTLIKRSRIVKIDQYINWITINFTMNHLLQDNLPESGSNV